MATPISAITRGGSPGITRAALRRQTSCSVTQRKGSVRAGDGVTPLRWRRNRGRVLAHLVRQSLFEPVPLHGAHFNVRTRGAARLVVLVHGFGGRGYATWGSLPAALFTWPSEEAVAVAVYDCPSYRERVPGLGGGHQVFVPAKCLKRAGIDDTVGSDPGPTGPQ